VLEPAPFGPRVTYSCNIVALYQGLYRLEGRELIAAEWGVTENGRRARYYKVTARRKAHLKQETATWVRYTETVTGILTGPREA